jgi:hypothetical protein
MVYSVRIHRISNGTRDYDARHLEAVRAAIAFSKDILKISGAADMFAGRKTQEPFPRERKKERRSYRHLARARGCNSHDK